MHFNLVDLDSATRRLMLAEFDDDLRAHRVYPSALVRPENEETCHEIQRAAFKTGDADSLCEALTAAGIFKPQDAAGRSVNVPAAADRLGDGQFVAYYIRALALRAIAEGRDLEVYRGQETAHHRPESDALIGTRPDPAQLLAEYREASLEPWRLPPIGRANSGLAVKLV